MLNKFTLEECFFLTNLTSCISSKFTIPQNSKDIKNVKHDLQCVVYIKLKVTVTCFNIKKNFEIEYFFDVGLKKYDK